MGRTLRTLKRHAMCASTTRAATSGSHALLCERPGITWAWWRGKAACTRLAGGAVRGIARPSRRMSQRRMPGLRPSNDCRFRALALRRLSVRTAHALPLQGGAALTKAFSAASSAFRPPPRSHEPRAPPRTVSVHPILLLLPPPAARRRWQIRLAAPPPWGPAEKPVAADGVGVASAVQAAAAIRRLAASLSKVAAAGAAT